MSGPPERQWASAELTSGELPPAGEHDLAGRVRGVSEPPAYHPLWESWAPKLDPPHEGGLPWDVAERIATSWWREDPYLAMALIWEAYAGMLPVEPAVTAVSTGAQSVTYSSGGGGEFGLASARAAWFRARAGSSGTVELRVVSSARNPCGR